MQRFITHSGAVVWITECQVPSEARMPTVLALTSGALVVGTVDFRRIPQEIERLRSAPDLPAALGKRPLRIPFTSILSAARYSQRSHLELRYQEGGKERAWQVYTPAYSDLFETLHAWIAPGRPTQTARIGLSQVTPSPREGIALFLMLIGGAGMFFWEESSVPQTNPLVLALYETGAALGPVGRPIAGGLAVLAGFAWIAHSLFNRPHREMLDLRPRG